MLPPVQVQLDGPFLPGDFVAFLGNARAACQRPKGAEALFRNLDLFLLAAVSPAVFERDEMFGALFAQTDFEMFRIQREVALFDPCRIASLPGRRDAFDEELAFYFQMPAHGLNLHTFSDASTQENPEARRQVDCSTERPINFVGGFFGLRGLCGLGGCSAMAMGFAASRCEKTA